MRIRPSHGFVHGQPPYKEVWLLAEWAEQEEAPTKYFLCGLPASYTLSRLILLAKCLWKIEQSYDKLKEELGLDHYKGRSWTGWHNHVTLRIRSACKRTEPTARRWFWPARREKAWLCSDANDAVLLW
jgi:SRSO17 transposase